MSPRKKKTNSPTSDSYIDRAKAYAERVIREGGDCHCHYVIKACERFNVDLKRKDITLDYIKPGKSLREGDRWCKFLETLPHVKGKWASKKQYFVLSDWQIFVTVNVFGWYRGGRRRFRDVYIEVPRKNGKTFWVAGIGIGMLAIDDEYGAEIYCGATTEKQAFEVFTPAKAICQREPDLRERYGIEVNAKTLTILSNGSKFEPIIGDPGDGSSPSCAITDEYHEHKDSGQVDTMETGMGAREQPLGIKITTAGSDMGGPCFEKRSDIIKILNNVIEDDSQFGIIYTIDEGDRWDSVEAQKKANPNYGISVDADFLQAQLNQARRSAIKQVAYKTKHLNLWVGAKSAWMNMLAYQVCRKNIKQEDHKGKEVYIAVDLASKTDFAAMVMLIPPQRGDRWLVFAKHYMPEETILNNDRYKAWHADGWIESTPGNVIDFEYIEDDMDAIKSQFQVIEVPYDPFQATQFSTRMMAKGFPMIEVGATVKNFSEPMKELESLILKKDIQFQQDPVLHWMFGNVVAKLDKKDNIFPDKERYDNKIDGVVALIMAVNRATHRKEAGSLDDFLREPIVL